MHSVWLVFMTKPVGQEQLERVGLAALMRHKDMQLLLLQGFATEKDNKNSSRLFQVCMQYLWQTNQVAVSPQQQHEYH